MDFLDWEPHYHRIIAEFGFSQEEDERAAQRLNELCAGKKICEPPCLSRLIGPEVTVLGHGPSLEEKLLSVELVGTVIAADGATSVLMHEMGRVPDMIVTDLDGEVPDQISANAQGAVVVVLAHGDNIPQLERFVPWLSGAVTPTTQSRPFDQVYDFGGFTDGDRAVILARHFGARRVHLIGFDFLNPRPKQGKDAGVKQSKLEVARRMIFDLNPTGTDIIVH